MRAINPPLPELDAVLAAMASDAMNMARLESIAATVQAGDLRMSRYFGANMGMSKFSLSAFQAALEVMPLAPRTAAAAVAPPAANAG
jgi:hypothetical protein